MNVTDGATTTIAPCTMADCPFPAPNAIAFFGTDMYLLNAQINNDFDGSIVRIPVAGGTETLMVTCLNQPYDLAVDATGIYWGENYELRRLAANNESVLYTGPGQLQNHVHVDAFAVYWVDTNYAGPVARIMKVAK